MTTITTARDLAAHARELLNHNVLPSHVEIYLEPVMDEAAVEAAIEGIREDVESEIKNAHDLCQDLNAYTGDSIWQDLLAPVLAPDRDQVDDGSSTVAVLACGTIVEYLESERRWRVAQRR